MVYANVPLFTPRCSTVQAASVQPPDLSHLHCYSGSHSFALLGRRPLHCSLPAGPTRKQSQGQVDLQKGSRNLQEVLVAGAVGFKGKRQRRPGCWRQAAGAGGGGWQRVDGDTVVWKRGPRLTSCSELRQWRGVLRALASCRSRGGRWKRRRTGATASCARGPCWSSSLRWRLELLTLRHLVAPHHAHLPRGVPPAALRRHHLVPPSASRSFGAPQTPTRRISSQNWMAASTAAPELRALLLDRSG